MKNLLGEIGMYYQEAPKVLGVGRSSSSGGGGGGHWRRGYGAPASTRPKGTNTRGPCRESAPNERLGSLKTRRIIDCTRVHATPILADLGSRRLCKRFEGAWEVCNAERLKMGADVGDIDKR
jgi:hypothetical protein